MSFTTLPGAGAPLRAVLLSALVTELRPVSAFKTSATSRASVTALAADPDLTIALPANSVWDWELRLVLFSAANAAGDFAGAMSYPADGVCSFSSVGSSDTLASGSSAPDTSTRGQSRDGATPSASFSFGCSTTENGALVLGRIEINTAGSLTLTWAQLGSNVNATFLQDGSCLIARRAS